MPDLDRNERDLPTGHRPGSDASTAPPTTACSPGFYPAFTGKEEKKLHV
jgi:hypothetical protein